MGGQLYLENLGATLALPLSSIPACPTEFKITESGLLTNAQSPRHFSIWDRFCITHLPRVLTVKDPEVLAAFCSLSCRSLPLWHHYIPLWWGNFPHLPWIRWQRNQCRMMHYVWEIVPSILLEPYGLSSFFLIFLLRIRPYHEPEETARWK